VSIFNFETPRVMGILNITPDSFSDGGRWYGHGAEAVNRAVQRAVCMHGEGAHFIDVGGESTRPGATAVSVQQELDRVIPIIEAIARECPAVVSVDTQKSEVMRAAVAAGARFVNDVSALQGNGALSCIAEAVAAGRVVGVCLMHMQGEPRSMQQAPTYRNVTEAVMLFLQQRLDACREAGIPADRLVVDPGFGFGKTLDHNLQLLRDLPQLAGLGCPLLVGVSRKSMVGALTGQQDPQHRLAGSLALAWACLERGAKILRVHDVRETVDVVNVYQRLAAGNHT